MPVQGVKVFLFDQHCGKQVSNKNTSPLFLFDTSVDEMHEMSNCILCSCWDYILNSLIVNVFFTDVFWHGC